MNFYENFKNQKYNLKNLVAVKINDEIYDLRDNYINSKNIVPIYTTDEEGLEVLRHDTAHILAEAVKIKFPESQITIGPVIENGFYYDIFLPNYNIKQEDLKDIERIMKKIIKKNSKIYKVIVKSSDAINVFLHNNENFKAKIIQDLKSDYVSIYIHGNIPNDLIKHEVIDNNAITSIDLKKLDYKKYFFDLCRGPHSMHTGVEKHFKLQKVSAAYWRGDQNNESLQRIYGTCWATKEDLNSHLDFLKQAEENDHRKLGPEMNLFHMQKEAHGSIFWHPKGWTLYKKIENYIRQKLKSTYEEVNTPQLIDKKLWEMSGHWSHFKENMFVFENEHTSYALKPMNCPAHIQIFKNKTKSYKDLPLRLSEFGSCHRNEPSGSMHGIMRLRNFVQDDAHIFCTPDHIEQETKDFCELLKSIYKDFGFNKMDIKLAGRPENSFGNDDIWKTAEEKLSIGAKKANLNYTLNPGEGAFYGPKLEFVIKDALNRDWQCGTLQLDFFMCDKLNAKYIDKDGTEKHPIMIHRAILGSMQRFIGILLEHHKGKLPLWLAPTQVAIVCLNNSDVLYNYADKLLSSLKNIHSEFNAYIDKRNESISYKLKDLTYKQKIPYVVIIGEKEYESNTVSFRCFNDKNNSDYDEFVENIEKEFKVISQ